MKPFTQLRGHDLSHESRSHHVIDKSQVDEQHGMRTVVENVDINDPVQDQSNRIIKILDTLLTSLYHLSNFSTSEEGTENKLMIKCESLRGTSLQVSQMLIRHLSMEKAQFTSRSPDGSLFSQISASTSAITKLLVSDHQISFKFRDCFGEPPEDARDFLESMATLREIVITNIKRTMSSKPSSTNVLEEAISKEHKENILSKHLKEKIENRRKSTSEILANKKKYIESLKRHIAVLHEKTEEVRIRIRTNDEKCHQELAPYHDQTKLQLTAELNTKRMTFSTMKEANRATEDKLHRRKVSSESEIQKTINDYDTAMIEKYHEVNDLRTDLESKKERIRFLTNYFRELDEARTAQAERERQERLRHRKLHSNLRIWCCIGLILQKHTRVVSKTYRKKKGKTASKKK